ncbi:MAG TPA: ABC transporter permease [Streptosporangiaceae bacterium]|jgi:ABC-type nitrate/sulfonate/bicarbonate transport system permease component|nr:ABC transporter permease [Streptosporangiaceae bacterium]
MRPDATEAISPPVSGGAAAPAGRTPPPRPRARLLVGALRRVAALWLFAALAVAWWVWSADSTSTFFPPLADIVDRLFELWIAGDATKNLTSSLQNFAFGYLIAGLAGVAAGTLLWMIRWARDAVSPFLYFLYVLPAPVLIPAAMTIFGLGSAMKVAIIVFAAVWPTLLNTLDGMRGVDPLKIDTARVLGMSGFRVVRSVVLPAALPQIVAGLRNSLQVAIILMVVSELVASTSGIGFFILNAQQSFAFVDMWTGIIVLALIGSVLNVLFVLIESRVLFWHYGARATEGKG